MKTYRDIEDKPTVWKLVACPNGSQWSYAHPAFAETVCAFSGCDCGQPVRIISTTESREVAAAWFKRP